MLLIEMLASVPFSSCSSSVLQYHGASPGWLGTDGSHWAVEVSLLQLSLSAVHQPWDPARSFHAKEETYSGYVQGKFGHDFSDSIRLTVSPVSASPRPTGPSGTGTVANLGGTTTLFRPIAAPAIPTSCPTPAHA